MISQETLNRNLKNCIMQAPVTVMHLGRQFQVKLNSTEDIMRVMDGGTLNDMLIRVVGTKVEFGDRPPRSGDDMKVLIGNQWILFQVRDVPGYFDPLSPSLSIFLQSTHKGIS